MSSPPSSTRPSQDQIRSRLLNRLGIYDAPPSSTAGTPMTAAQSRRLRILRGMGVGHELKQCPEAGSRTRLPLDGVVPFQEPLKADYDMDEEEEENTNSRGLAGGLSANSSSDAAESKPSRIAFQDEVEVMPIPTRYEYSDRIKSRIWSNRHELQENAERNALEFAAEGWNWRNVTEDEGMYICSVSGELVHPIHLQQLMVNEAAAAEGNNNGASTTPASPTNENEGPPSAGGLERGAPVHSR